MNFGCEILIAESPQMKQLLEMLSQVSKTYASILISGPSGVGKEVLTKYVHQTSLRNRGPFVVLNCAAIHENLIESELFGYEKGAFSGASSSGKEGLIETADGGTLFFTSKLIIC
ncbi:sigma 54-interacting transcriptional regulator [Sedimentibacter sp.]|uniref:sigma 54-interacting transcriptional regulator n=1 Tax=Sedimentibacter sp. TaxID=1960295 RepID=UPI0037D9AF6B